MKILWTLITMAALVSTMVAAPLDDKVKSFADALKASNAAKNTNDPMASERMANISAQFAMSLGDSGDAGNLEPTVRQFLATNSDPAVQAAGKALLDELSAQRKARADAFKSQLDAVMVRVPDVLTKAQKTQELDGILNDLQKLQPPRRSMYGNDQDMQVVMNQVNQAYQFVAQWQDYLSNRNSGNTQEAANSLRNMLNSRQAGEAMPIPRSEILSRIDQLGIPKNGMGMPAPPPLPSNLDPIFDGIKTLDDMSPALEALRKAGNQGSEYNQLSQLVNIYAEVKNGLPVSLDVYSNQWGNPPVNPGLARVRAMLFIYLLPRFIGAEALVPNANESVTDYLKRSTDAAEAKQDWITLQRIVEAQAKVAKAQNYSGGTRSFLTALNQDMTGQYALAVVSYQSAIRDADDTVPVKVAGDRLAAIKKDHPDEYEEGMKKFLNPPVPNYINPAMLNYMYQRGMAPGMPMTNGALFVPAPPMPVASTNAAPVTSVPAASATNAAPTPSAPEKK